jgi:5-methyltetrahydropteroyltriglutamate--homocysteine methyltransferase
MASLAARERRILTTHAGSLPRRTSLSALLLARMNRQPFDAAALARENTEAVKDMQQQRALGIDIVSDGEQSKTSFQHYMVDRLSGLEPITPKAGETWENIFPRSTRRRASRPGASEARLHRPD